MDIPQYIASGVLESYVLGLTSGQQSREVEENMGLYPELDRFVGQYQKLLEDYARLHEVKPPVEWKDQIWNVIRDQKQPVQPPEMVPPPVVAGEIQGPEIPSRRTRIQGWLAAAATVLLMVSIVLNLHYRSRYTRVRSSYDQLIVSRNDLVTQNQVYQSRISQLESDMRVIHDPSLKPVVMEGGKSHPGMMATIFWNPATRSVFLALNKLPEPPSGMQYQLWAIVDGKPVSLGVFGMEGAGAGLKQMGAISGAQAFAITLEKQGGSSRPTMANLFVSGKV